MNRWLLTLLALGVLIAAATAQDRDTAPSPGVQPLPDIQDGERFALQPVEGGVLRVDRRTGAVSSCRPRNGGWVCTLAADERQALETEIARLQARVAELEGGDPQAKRNQPALRLPTGKELQDALDSVGTLLRRFLEALQALRERIERGS